MALQNKVEEFDMGFQLLEIRQYRILAAEADIEALLAQSRKGLCCAFELQPIRCVPCRMEKDILMPSLRELVADLQVAPDASEDLDMREQRSYLHLTYGDVPQRDTLYQFFLMMVKFNKYRDTYKINLIIDIVLM